MHLYDHLTKHQLLFTRITKHYYHIYCIEEHRTLFIHKDISFYYHDDTMKNAGIIYKIFNNLIRKFEHVYKRWIMLYLCFNQGVLKDILTHILPHYINLYITSPIGVNHYIHRRD